MITNACANGVRLGKGRFMIGGHLIKGICGLKARTSAMLHQDAGQYAMVALWSSRCFDLNLRLALMSA